MLAPSLQRSIWQDLKSLHQLRRYVEKVLRTGSRSPLGARTAKIAANPRLSD